MKYSYLVITVFFIILSGCGYLFDTKEHVNTLELPDKEYDISMYVSESGVFAPEYMYVYVDFRDGDLIEILRYNLMKYGIKIERYNKDEIIMYISYSEFISPLEPYDTLIYKLKSKKDYLQHGPIKFTYY